MSVLTIGIESLFFSIMLSITFLIYAFLFLPVVKKSFIKRSQNRWNSMLVIVLLVFIAIFISLPFSATTFYLFMPMNWFLIVMVGVLTLFFFLFALIKKKTIDESAFNEQLQKGMNENLDKTINDTHNFTLKQEFKRKIIHLCAIFYVASWILQPLIFYGVQYLYAGVSNTTSAENFYNSQFLFEYSNVALILQNALVSHFFMLLVIFMANANAEVMRLRFPNKAFVLKKTLQKTRRPTEINDISPSLLLLLGLATSSIILTYGTSDRILGIFAQIGVIIISVFSDMFAALIGRKWGKHKWWCAKGKSYEGTIAGFLIGVFSSIIFLGPIIAFIGGAIFVFTDIALDKLKISDNALNPILMAITFKILIGLVHPLIPMLPIIIVW
ncbi:MAG: hypothetical protein JW891_03835 [Candidatus Lokiarchaeota archaeon]|nr:hypothetical protein [Candidatus Lokiarchaeota archaeon]